MVRALSAGTAAVVEVRRLAGGVDAATHAVRLDRGGWLVVKRAAPAHAKSLDGEFKRLEFARRAPIATPDPIGLDADGSWFGHPALVMSFLPGRGTLPEESPSWIDNLAQALAAVHSTRIDGDVPAVLRAPHAGRVWEPAPATELPRNRRVDALVEAGLSVRERPGDRTDAEVLLHHDFHHGNILWHGSRVTGVLDWNEARLGPPDCDVAYCSVDIAMTHGLEAAERFIAAYTVVGARLAELRRWQCLWTANAMRWIKYWITGFHEAGIELSLPAVRRRLDAFADRLLGEL